MSPKQVDKLPRWAVQRMASQLVVAERLGVPLDECELASKCGVKQRMARMFLRRARPGRDRTMSEWESPL